MLIKLDPPIPNFDGSDSEKIRPRPVDVPSWLDNETMKYDDSNFNLETVCRYYGYGLLGKKKNQRMLQYVDVGFRAITNGTKNGSKVHYGGSILSNTCNGESGTCGECFLFIF